MYDVSFTLWLYVGNDAEFDDNCYIVRDWFVGLKC